MNLYDCHGGPGTTEPACGACVTCLHRVIEQKDQRIKRLEEALRRIDNQDYRGNRSTESQIAFHALKEAKP